VYVGYGSCQQVIPAAVGGYPTPNINWYYNGAKLTDDHQDVLTVMRNNSVSLGCVLYNQWGGCELLVL